MLFDKGRKVGEYFVGSRRNYNFFSNSPKRQKFDLSNLEKIGQMNLGINLSRFAQKHPPLTTFFFLFWFSPLLCFVFSSNLLINLFFFLFFFFFFFHHCFVSSHLLYVFSILFLLFVLGFFPLISYIFLSIPRHFWVVI